MNFDEKKLTSSTLQMSLQNKEVNLDLFVKFGLHFLHLSNEISQLWSSVTHQQVKLAYLKEYENPIDVLVVKADIDVHTLLLHAQNL